MSSSSEKSRRTLNRIIFWSLAFLVALRLHIVSVPLFIAIAWANLLTRRRPVRPYDSAAWAHLGGEALPNVAAPQRRARTLITYHPWYHNFNPSLVDTCLREAANVGAGYVRSDIRWSDLLPDGASVDSEAGAWYRGYFASMMRQHGLQPVAVLSSPPSSIEGLSGDQKLIAWRRYVEAVTIQVGDLCSTYQVLNEPNNPIYRIFPDDQLFSAISTASRIIKARTPEATVIVNFLGGIPGWRQKVGKIVTLAQGIDIIGLDYFPGTWTISFWSDRQQMQAFLRDIDSLLADIKLGPSRVAIIETGYSSNLPFLRTDRHQAEYFDVLREVFAEYFNRRTGDVVSLFGVYELCDACTARPLDPEAHFGILRSDNLARKPAFDTVRRLFAAL